MTENFPELVFMRKKQRKKGIGELNVTVFFKLSVNPFFGGGEGGWGGEEGRNFSQISGS